MKPTELVQNYFTAFHARDRETVDALLSDDFTFSSPLDDKINKASYFERCWPNDEHLSEHQIEKLFAEGDEVFAIYSCARSDGTRFRNTEFFRTASARITQVEVFFGSKTAATFQEVEIDQLRVFDVKRKSPDVRISPGRKLGPAGKERPPKVEKLAGGEVPPPERAAKAKRRRQ